MKKTILALVAGSMMASSVGFAAPINNLEPGEVIAGYSHYGMAHDTNNDSFYAEGANSDKFTMGVEHNNYSDSGNGSWNTTDIYAQYKLDPNFRLILGDRSYDYGDESSKIIYGIGVTTNLGPKMDGYASVIGNSITTEWQAGVKFAVSDNVSVNVGYKSNKDNGYLTYDGVGAGINYKF